MSSVSSAKVNNTTAAAATIPAEWSDTWDLFDDRRTGAVSQTDLKHIMRSLGRRHTESEFRDMLQPLSDPVERATFIQLMLRPYSGPSEDDLFTALRAFDASDCGALRLSELVTLLSSLGEKMPEAEVRQLLAELHPNEDGKVSIEELVQFLCSPVPTTTPDIVELQKQLGQPVLSQQI